MLYQAKKTRNANLNLQQNPYSQAQLRGMIAYVHMVNPRQAQPLKNAM